MSSLKSMSSYSMLLMVPSFYSSLITSSSITGLTFFLLFLFFFLTFLSSAISTSLTCSWVASLIIYLATSSYSYISSKCFFILLRLLSVSIISFEYFFLTLASSIFLSSFFYILFFRFQFSKLVLTIRPRFIPVREMITKTREYPVKC